MDSSLSIGDVAARTGLATSAIRFYEAKGLIRAERTASGHRSFHRSVIRRLSFIMVTQQLGYRLDEIRERLESLPADRAPSQEEWARLGTEFAADLDQRIDRLTSLRERLGGCIGCGCLSLDACALYNPDDRAHEGGVGPRYLLGDQPM